MGRNDVRGKVPPLSGGIGISHLRVYTSKAPDGLPGGCPHMHFVSTETYYILSGRGSVQILSYRGFQEVPLEPGKLVWFTPGVIHRLINGDGQLELLVIMPNAGLPEAGDHVLTFPPHILADEELYYRFASLATAEGHVYASDEEAAFRRRDLAVEGFNDLRRRMEREGSAAITDFYRQAIPLVVSKAGRWRDIWERNVTELTQRAEEYLDAIGRGEGGYLQRGWVYTLPPPGEERRFGFCGWLSPYTLEGVLSEKAEF
ncbi:MAG: cupin [Deltaproteobacteria bacterium]|nr:MAG: cupin [Deltaproteobacteria bacterium]